MKLTDRQRLGIGERRAESKDRDRPEALDREVIADLVAEAVAKQTADSERSFNDRVAKAAEEASNREQMIRNVVDKVVEAEVAKREGAIVKSVLSFRRVIGAIAVLVLLFGGSVWGTIVYTQSQAKQIITSQVGKEFERPDIKTTFTEVANARATGLMNEQLQPAIDRLNKELTRQTRTIRSLSARVHLTFRGNWTNGQPPNLGAVILTGGRHFNPMSFVEASSGKPRPINLFPDDTGEYQMADAKTLSYDVFEIAQPDSWVMGLDPDSLVGCQNVYLNLERMSAAATTDARIQFQSMIITVTINSIPTFSCTVSMDDSFETWPLSGPGPVRLLWQKFMPAVRIPPPSP